ncbi:MAG: nucleotidyltransferase domain-containing protein [Candidatus Lambdaproteobacteria bacterium]|nr:nucleotidyltransferase domain-containing protein [Candidatus Lambdaproteobacteria bacterium]
MTVPDIQIAPRHWEVVAALLERHVPHCDVWVFGSRAKHQAKPYSDLDLVMAGDGPLPLATLAALAAELEDSALPFKVDVVDWATLSPSFRETIRSTSVRVQTAAA